MSTGNEHSTRPDPAPAGPTDDEAGGALRRVYLRAIEAAPASWEPRIRASATWVRLGRRAVRRAVRRSLQAMLRGGRAAARRYPVLSPYYRSLMVTNAWIQRLIPPTVMVEGEGDVIVVDARGHTAGEVAEVLAMRGQARVVVIVDDPDLTPLRAAGIVYEFVPPVGVGGLDRDEQQRLVDDRRPSFDHLYRAVTDVAFADLLGRRRLSR